MLRADSSGGGSALLSKAAALESEARPVATLPVLSAGDEAASLGLRASLRTMKGEACPPVSRKSRRRSFEESPS
jgi:hypothetical protein